jgi:hypothetical protein
MEPVIIIYCFGCYLYTIGLIAGGIKEGRTDPLTVFGMLLHLITAPIFTPVLLGYIKYQEQSYL